MEQSNIFETIINRILYLFLIVFFPLIIGFSLGAFFLSFLIKFVCTFLVILFNLPFFISFSWKFLKGYINEYQAANTDNAKTEAWDRYASKQSEAIKYFLTDPISQFFKELWDYFKLPQDDIHQEIYDERPPIINIRRARVNTPQIINTPQSTHTASVHQSVSDSAIALKNRYGHNISNDEVTNQINQLRSEINNFSPNQTITTHIHEAAKRGLNRLENLNTDFIDPSSQLSVKELIALTFMAGKDDNYRQHTFTDFLDAMMLALYEIQRGYNLDKNGNDDMCKDDTICIKGTFNKIIEKMVSILPDCHIHLITFDVVTLTANKLVNDIISQFFNDRASLNLPNEEELSSLEKTQRETYVEHLRDILNDESNHEDNPLFNALNAKLLQEVDYGLRKEVGSQLKNYINKNFTLDEFIDLILNSEQIKRPFHKMVNDHIKAHQTNTNLTQNSLFSSTNQGLNPSLNPDTLNNDQTIIKP